MILSLAARILRHDHVRGSAIAIGLALVPLIVILIVADGMIEGITSRYIELKTYHYRVYLSEGMDPQTALAALRRQAGVVGAYLEVDGEGLVRTGAGGAAVLIRGLDPSLARDPGFSRYLSIVEGLFDLETPRAVLVGVRTAQTLGLQVGDELGLATVASGSFAAPRIGRLRVTGIFSTGYQELDRNWVFVSTGEALRVLSPERREPYLGVKVADPFGDRVKQALELRAALPPGSRVYDWYEIERNQFRSFEITRNLLAFVMALVVVVGCVNVSSAVLTVVLERQRDIGILKSMGAGPRAVRRVFLLVGVCVGVVGGIGGTALGLLLGIHVNELFALVELLVNGFRAGLAWAQPEGGALSAFRVLGSGYYLERIPIHVRLGELYAAAAGTTVLAAVAAWLPSRRAGRLRPLEVIRKQ